MHSQSQKDKTSDLNSVPSRRSFLSILWGLLGVAVLVEAGWLTISFLKTRQSNKNSATTDTWIETGPVDSFDKNSVTAFPRGQFYLVCLEDGGFLAASRRCTHLGCTVPWDEEEKKFICPCHASLFDIRGDVIQSPAPRALDIFPMVIENNKVRVDTRKAIRRSAFQKEQVLYPTDNK